MVRQAHHERNQQLIVRLPKTTHVVEPVEGLNQSFLNKPANNGRRIRSLADHIPPGQLLRYLVVGFGNTAFAYGSFALFTAMLDKYMPSSYLAGSLLSSLLNITVSFLNYKWFVFKTKGSYLKEWFKCLMVYSTSIIMGLVLLPPTVFLVTYATENLAAAPYIAGALIMCVNVIISFIGHKKFSFKSTTDS
ncbi:MAG: GtrA family protein [Methylomicrobium sp.]